MFVECNEVQVVVTDNGNEDEIQFKKNVRHYLHQIIKTKLKKILTEYPCPTERHKHAHLQQNLPKSIEMFHKIRMGPIMLTKSSTILLPIGL